MSDSNQLPPSRLVEDPSRPALKQLLGGVTVPAPPPGARERSWSRLTEQRAHRPPMKALALGAALGACAAVVVLSTLRPDVGLPAATIATRTPMPPVSGEVTWLRPDAAPDEVWGAATVIQGAWVKTGAAMRATVRFPGSVLELEEHTSLRVSRLEAGVAEVVLESGSLMAKRQSGVEQRLTVRSRDAFVEGASFAVKVAADGTQMTVQSFEGSTVVREGGRTMTVEKGAVWPAQESKPQKPQKIALMVPRSNAASQEAQPDAPDPESPPQDAALWSAASSAIREGRIQDAIAPLQSLAGGEGAYAGLALYELGRVRARHLGDPAGAKEAFSQYRERMPAGPLRTEVDVSLAELLLGQGAFDEAQVIIDDLLDNDTASARQPELRLLRAHVWRERGDFEAASAEYLALGQSAGRIGADALYYGAFCEQKLGRWDSARSLLEAYVSRFPGGRFEEEAKRALELFEGVPANGHSRPHDSKESP
ncbi:MAG: tetratricopeptide repeat protein [Myxococcaceae bacterium]